MPSRSKRDRGPSNLLQQVAVPPSTGPGLTILRSTQDGLSTPGVDQNGLVRLDRLAFEHQPREIIPEEALQQLIVAGEAHPAAVLAKLEEAAATDPYYQGILDELRGLAASIASEGVLQPIRVVLKADERGEQLVVRDGHRRCLASYMAGKQTILAHRVEESDELAAVAHPLIVNLQRQDLTAIEKGAALLRLALAVGRRLATEAGVDPGAVTIDALVAREVMDTAESTRVDSMGTDLAEAVPLKAPVQSTRVDSTVTGLPRTVAAAVRDRVCAMTGLNRSTYYNYLALNRLAPDARAAGRGLTEGQLRAIVPLPEPVQTEVVAFAVRRGLNSKEIASVARVAREGDRDRLRDRLARLEGTPPGGGRTSVSWEGLLHAVPRDMDRRVQALAAELKALTPEARQKRLDAIREQRELLLGLADYFARLLEQYDDKPEVVAATPVAR